jgi:hypothetical protein
LAHEELLNRQPAVRLNALLHTPINFLFCFFQNWSMHLQGAIFSRFHVSMESQCLLCNLVRVCLRCGETVLHRHDHRGFLLTQLLLDFQATLQY